MYSEFDFCLLSLNFSITVRKIMQRLIDINDGYSGHTTAMLTLNSFFRFEKCRLDEFSSGQIVMVVFACC